jgi:hypothetical protein
MHSNQGVIMRNSSIVTSFLLAMLAWARPVHAAESYANCTGFVTALPTVITTPGTWCVKQDLSSASSTVKGITVNSDNVTLDCNDFGISGTGGTATTATGVFGQNRLNVTVRHCNIQGFRYGVLLQGATGGAHVIEDNHFEQNVFEAVHVEGDGSVVRRNEILDTGGSTTTVSSYGIYTVGAVNIQDNSVSVVTAHTGGNGSAYGIYTSGNTEGTINLNRVRGMAKDGTGKVYGIWNATSGRLTLRDNDVFGDASAGSVGLACANSTGRSKNDMISGFATALQKCGDGGENDITP